MNRPKSPKASNPPISEDLRAKDPQGTRAEIAVLRERTSALVAKDPRKAAVVLEEWVSRPASRKKAA